MQPWFYRLPPTVRGLLTAAWVFAALFGVTQLYALDGSPNVFGGSVSERLVVSAVAGGYRARSMAALARCQPPVNRVGTGRRSRLRGAYGAAEPEPPVGAGIGVRIVGGLAVGAPA